jgi:glycerophosphoryl diester phosphodiesterase
VSTNSKRRKVVGTLILGGLMQGCGGGGGGGGGGGSAASGPVTAPVTPTPSPTPSPPPADPGPTLSGLAARPLYIAHRGGAAMYPEETDVAYDQALKSGQMLLECDVQMLSDGNLALMHDSSVDRTTTSTGAVNTFDTAGWRTLRADANVWHGSNYGNDLTVPLFRDWLQAYRGKAVFVPEDKDGRSMEAMLAAFADLQIGRDQVLLQCFNLAPLKLAVAAGYQTCFLNNNAATAIEDVQAAGVGWVALPVGTPDAMLKKWAESSLKVLIWTVNRRFQRDQWLLLGLRGFFSDDPQYLQGTAPLSTGDQFGTGTWAPGMLGNGSDTSLELRGKFFSGGYWGYATTKAGYLGCLQGYLCPVRPANAARVFDLSLKVSFDAALTNDGTRYASLFLGVDDRTFLDSNEWSAGYQVMLRKNGTVEIQKKGFGVKTVTLQTGATGAIADGEEVGYRVSVTEDALTVVRINKDGSDGVATLARDNTLNTTYVHLGRNGLACRFRQLQIK